MAPVIRVIAMQDPLQMMPQLLRFKTSSILFFCQVRPLGDFRILRLTFFDIAWNENTEINRVRYSIVWLISQSDVFPAFYLAKAALLPVVV